MKIQSVSEGSAAETVGLQAGDQIIKVGDLDLDNVESAGKFAPYVQSHAPGETLSLVVVRGDQQLVLSPTLDALPPPERQRLYPPEQRSRLFDTWLREQLKSKE